MILYGLIWPIFAVSCGLEDFLQAAFLLQTLMQVLALGSLRKAWRFGASIMVRTELLLAPRSPV